MENMNKIIAARMRPLARRSRKQRNFLLGFLAVAGTGYGLYRLYRCTAIARKRYQFFRFLTSLVTIAESAAASAETVKLVSNDLKSFLQSDSDEIPTSIKQLLKAARSPEFRQTLTGVSSALTSGVLQGVNPNDGGDRDPDSPGVADRMMDKLLTPAGTGFVSVVVGSFARNLVLGLFENSANSGAVNGPSSSGGSNPRPPGGGVSGFVDVICSGKGKALVGECIQQFVSTAVSIYLDKTMHINTYDDIFAALVNPARHAQMKGFLISVCNGAVETLVRTSHEVLTNGSSSSGKDGMVQIKPESQSSQEGQVKSENLKDQKIFSDLRLFRPNSSQKMQLSNGIDGDKIIVETHNVDSGSSYRNWIDKISYTLAVPSNRRLFIEVSGRMTFEAVRSFFEFMLCKVSEFLTRTVPEVSHEAMDKVLNVMRYVGAKTIVIATLCLAICLHVSTGVRILEVMQ